jgi:hypothetical protein
LGQGIEGSKTGGQIMTQAHKISFQDAWDSSVIFFVDAALEQEIEKEVESLLETEKSRRGSRVSATDLAGFLAERKNALDVVLKDLGLSIEKFMRIVSLLRKLERIPGGFDKEWGIAKIKSKIAREPQFAALVAELLLDGKRDRSLEQHLPRYYLESLNYREIQVGSETAQRERYKRLLIGTYGARKGHAVENKIRQRLTAIETKHGVGFAKGRSRIIETDIDFAIPNLEDPWSSL